VIFIVILLYGFKSSPPLRLAWCRRRRDKGLKVAVGSIQRDTDFLDQKNLVGALVYFDLFSRLVVAVEQLVADLFNESHSALLLSAPFGVWVLLIQERHLNKKRQSPL
jgi:hypothetical protein